MALNACECGCGEPAGVYAADGPGYRAGEPKRFLRGHNTRVKNPRAWTDEERAAQAKRMRENGPFTDPEVRRKISESKRGVPRPDRCGRNHPMWAGEKVTRGGYVFVWQPTHPLAEQGLYQGRVGEHVLVAEKALGRTLDPENELVHHINFDGTDNRPRNLMVCSRSYHTWLHHKIRRRGLEDYFKGLR